MPTCWFVLLRFWVSTSASAHRCCNPATSCFQQCVSGVVVEREDRSCPLLCQWRSALCARAPAQDSCCTFMGRVLMTRVAPFLSTFFMQLRVDGTLMRACETRIFCPFQPAPVLSRLSLPAECTRPEHGRAAGAGPVVVMELCQREESFQGLAAVSPQHLLQHCPCVLSNRHSFPGGVTLPDLGR